MLPQEKIHLLANRLHDAEMHCKPVESLMSQEKFSVEDAYQIQMVNAARQMKAGKRLVGYKVGLTSHEAQKMFNVYHPDFGHLFDTMCVEDEGEIDAKKLIHPKIEGEIAFVLGKTLQGPGVTVADVVQSVDCVMGAFEIVDSRIANWKITAQDTIADNGSSALYVLTGKPVLLKELDLPHLGMALSRNGEVVITASGAAVMGNPLHAVAFLANELGRHGRALVAGEVVLSGSLGGMIPLVPGDFYSCEFLKLGRVNVHVRKGDA